MIKKEPITIQPCSLVKPLPSIPAGQVQKITIQNGQQAKVLQQGKGRLSLDNLPNKSYVVHFKDQLKLLINDYVFFLINYKIDNYNVT